MNREDVQALLQACKRDRIGPHPDNETLAALCRAWLEMESAPAGRQYHHSDDDWIVTPDEDGGVDHPYVRVRIVPVDGGDGDVDYWGSKPNGGEDDWTGYDG